LLSDGVESDDRSPRLVVTLFPKLSKQFEEI
jgi:hypothetical protein